MKVTAKKFVNARTQEASVNAENPFYIEPGNQIEIKDVVIGTAIDGNAIWYFDVNDFYYWSGGFVESGFELHVFETQIEISNRSRQFQFEFLASMLPDFIIKYGKDDFKAIGIAEIGGGLGIEISLASHSDIQKYAHLQSNKILFRGYSVPIQLRYQSPFRGNSGFIDYTKPFLMGGSIENEISNNYGTRGLKLEMQGKTVILTCFHVACYNLMEQRKNSFDKSLIKIRFPARESNSPVSPATGNVINGKLGGWFDYALIEVTADMCASKIPGIGWPNDYYQKTELNKLTTGTVLKTFGFISDRIMSGKITMPSVASSYAIITYDYLHNVKLYGLIETEKMSVEGDSGAAVLDQNNKVVGIIIASNDTHSLIMPYCKLLDIHPLKLN